MHKSRKHVVNRSPMYQLPRKQNNTNWLICNSTSMLSKCKIAVIHFLILVLCFLRMFSIRLFGSLFIWLSACLFHSTIAGTKWIFFDLHCLSLYAGPLLNIFTLFFTRIPFAFASNLDHKHLWTSLLTENCSCFFFSQNNFVLSLDFLHHFRLGH